MIRKDTCTLEMVRGVLIRYVIYMVPTEDDNRDSENIREGGENYSQPWNQTQLCNMLCNPLSIMRGLHRVSVLSFSVLSAPGTA